MKPLNAFVIMPFADGFSDVYLVLQDSFTTSDLSHISVLRADEIALPGRITDQILESIGNCDLVIADITGNNPNVMFELGYARALNKPTIIVNQDIAAAPFDIAEMRQIVYDRQRLVGDLKPQVINSLRATLKAFDSKGLDLGGSELHPTASTSPPNAPDEHKPPPNATEYRNLLEATDITDKLSVLEMEVEMARDSRDTQRLRQLASQAIALIDKLDFPSASESALSALAGEIGDIAVEFHNSELFREAEDLFNRAIGVDDKHTGVFIQYSLYLALRKKDFRQAEDLLAKAEVMGGNARRIENARSRIAAIRANDSTEVSTDLVDEFRHKWETNPSSFEHLMAYLLVLKKSGNTSEMVGQYEKYRTQLPDMKSKNGYSIHRSFADSIAVDNNSDSEEFARKIYEELIQIRPNDHEVLSNLAVLLLKGDPLQQSRGMLTYVRAYNIDREEILLRRGFSKAIKDRTGRSDIAAKVVRSEQLSSEEIAAITQVAA
jgi:tetratricopeptide (TPR) repeat protein